MLVSLENVTVKRNGRAVLHDVSLTLKAGEIMTVIGPNGAGKTTLIKAILGLLSVSQGQIRQQPDLRIGYMPQKLYLNPLMPMLVETFLKLIAPQSTRGDIDEILALVKATSLLTRDLHQLSGGEWQRILLAQALLTRPNLLILDEPTQGVDISGQAEFYQHIQEARDRYGCGVILISHDLHVVMSASDVVICLNHHVCCSGHPSQVQEDDAFRAMFGHAPLAPYNHHHDHSHD